MTDKEKLVAAIKAAQANGLSAEDILEIIVNAFDTEEIPQPKASQSESDIEKRVTDILIELGMPAHISGFRYTRTAIIMVYEEPDMMSSVTKILYPNVAKKYVSTNSRVERGIRHAIEVAWDRATPEIMEKYFGYTINEFKGKPTNSEFIAMIADRLSLERPQANK